MTDPRTGLEEIVRSGGDLREAAAAVCRELGMSPGEIAQRLCLDSEEFWGGGGDFDRPATIPATSVSSTRPARSSAVSSCGPVAGVGRDAP